MSTDINKQTISHESIIEADWEVPDGIRAISTTRLGGCSHHPFDSFNLGDHVGDQYRDVGQNRQFLQQLLKLNSAPCWLKQVHSNKLVESIEQNNGEEADGSYTGDTARSCVVMTADCLPVVMYNPESRKIAAVHAGWKGLAEGIIEKALEAVGNKNTIIWLGPAIGADRFEVGKEVVEAFTALSTTHATAFRQISDNKWLANIYELARQKLAKHSVDKVFGGQYCTMTDSKLFYSYRRDKTTGRMATLVWFEVS